MCSSDTVSLVYLALGVRVISHQKEKKIKERKCKVICSDPVSASPVPREKVPCLWKHKHLYPSQHARPPIHHSSQALGSTGQIPFLPFMTLSIGCQGLAQASLLTTYEDFSNPSNSHCAIGALQSWRNSKRPGRDNQFCRGCSHRASKPTGPGIATGVPQGLETLGSKWAPL